MKFFAGIIDPETLSQVEKNPQGELSKAAGMCSALEIRYDLFISQGISENVLPQIAERLAGLFPETLLIGTFRLKRDGGAISNDLSLERDRWMLPVLSANTVPRLFDVEIECLGTLLPKLSPAFKRKSVQVLASHHDFQKVPETAELERLIAEARAAGADGFKTACMATAPESFDAAYALISKEAANFKYFSLFAMGNFGRESRTKSLLRGANLTYCSLRTAVAPGQLSIAEALEKYRKMCQNR